MEQTKLDPTTAEIVSLYRTADQEAKELIYRMILLASKYGTPFLQDTEKAALAGDRDALRQIFQKWEEREGGREP
jgi:hypothetical protein